MRKEREIRRGKSKSLKVELDLSGGYSMVNMRKSGLEGKKESRAVFVGNAKHREDLEMYSQLPYYDEFQGHDTGIETVLSQIAQKIYANFHKPSWGTLKRHLLMTEIPKKLFRALKIISVRGHRRFQTRKNVWRAAKIPIDNAFKELVEMDCLDYGDYVAFLQIHDTFRDFL